MVYLEALSLVSREKEGSGTATDIEFVLLYLDLLLVVGSAHILDVVGIFIFISNELLGLIKQARLTEPRAR